MAVIAMTMAMEDKRPAWPDRCARLPSTRNALATKSGSANANALHRRPTIVKSVASIVSNSAPARNANPIRAARSSMRDANDQPKIGNARYERT